MVRTIEAERAVGLMVFQQLCAGETAFGSIGVASGAWGTKSVSFTESLTLVVWRNWFSGSDGLLFLKHYQGMLEGARRLNRGEGYPLVGTELDGLYRQAERQLMSPFPRGYLFSRVATPNLRRAFEIVAENETQRQMALAVLAARRHQQRQGTWPRTLGLLVPELLASEPHDGFAGVPLKWEVGREGNVRLYSVGRNGQDDGGNAEPAVLWDEYRGPWDGRDAVWPRPWSDPGVESAVAAEVLPVVQFDEVPIGEALKSLADAAGLVLVIDPEVAGVLERRVSYRLANVSRREAWKIIAQKERIRLVELLWTNVLAVTVP
jgi:hypothetical protein